MKLSKQEERLRQELVAELKAAGQSVDRSFADLIAALERITSDVNMAIRHYNVALLKARVFVEGVAESRRDEFDEKSDRWKEGDSGQEADSFIQEWEEFRAEPLDQVYVLQPELEEKPCHATALEELPSESN